MSRSIQRHVVPVRGGNLTVAEWPAASADDAPVILAIHGITASHMAWTLVAEALPQFRILAPDLRGRGRSNALPGPYGMRQHAEDCAAILESFAIDRALVVGHSMGAFVATVFASLQAKRVEALLLVDGGLPLALPPGMDKQTVITAALGAALARLSMTFSSQAAYHDFWRAHPAMLGNWSPSVQAYVDYDLVDGHASTPVQAVGEDSNELFGSAEYEQALTYLPKLTHLLTAPRGLLDDPPGLYPAAAVASWKSQFPALTVSEVPDINHYMIVMGPRGAEVVAAEVTRLHALARR